MPEAEDMPRPERLSFQGNDLFPDLIKHDGRPLDFALLQPCDILVEPDHDLYGLVAKVFGSPDQHALLVSEDVHFAWESIQNGVHRNPISPTKPYQVYRLKEDVPPEILNAILAAAKEDDGKAYGYLELLADAERLEGFNVTLDAAEDNDAQVCSGYVHRWYRKAGIALCPGKPDHLVFPLDLATSNLVHRVS